MAKQATLVRYLPCDLKYDLVIRQELAIVVYHPRQLTLISGLPCVRQVLDCTFDHTKGSGCGGCPTEVMHADLLTEQGLIVPRIRIMTTEAVDLKRARKLPSIVRVGHCLRPRTDAATWHMPAKCPHEPPI